MESPSQNPSYLCPNWPAPSRVHAVCTTRIGGFSQAPFNSFNCASHVGDTPQAVDNNQAKLKSELNLSLEPLWLNQVHSATVIHSDQVGADHADAAYTRTPLQSCVVLTADCLPILLCDQAGTTVGAIHGGWRGLNGGIITNTIARMAIDPSSLMAWLGPAIGPDAFEVGPEVREAFLSKSQNYNAAFMPGEGDRYYANIFLLASLELNALGIHNIYSDQLCTFSDPERFYSYRRDGSATGRMASLIWLSD